MGKIRDLTGQTFGELTVISCAGKLDGRRYFCFFICSCGQEKVIPGASLTSGNTKSCGHLRNKIEDLTGNIITVANRKIDEITVLSGRVVINVPLSYELKVREYKKVMDEVVKEINKNNEKLNARYLGVNNFNDSSIDHLIVFDSNPLDRYQDRRDVLNIILKVLEDNNVEIPDNQLDIHNK